MSRIIYLGRDTLGTTSLHRSLALERLGHDVSVFNPYNLLQDSLFSKISYPFHYRTGYRLIQKKINSWLKELLIHIEESDLIWIDNGELFGRSSLEILKHTNSPIVLYNIDDPTGGRDGRRFDSLKEALDLYDLTTFVREETKVEAEKLGAKNSIRVFMSYDEVAHKPFRSKDLIPDQFKSEVVFIGTWMRNERRDEFMLKLCKAGLPISIWGARWQKSPYWTELKPYYSGGNLAGRDYVAAIQGAKICIGLLSSGNRDLHTTRSLETPYAGGLLCAERTSEHLQLYKGGKEAIFWHDAEECIQKCKELLGNDEGREQIRKAGMKRVRELGVGNEDVCKKILNEIQKL